MTRFLFSIALGFSLSSPALAGTAAVTGSFWQQRSQAPEAMNHLCACTDGTLVVATGYAAESYGTGMISVSADGGLTWTIVHQTGNRPLPSVAFGNGRFVAVGQEGFFPAKGYVLTSTNGREWTSATISGSGALQEVTWTGSRFIAVSDTGKILSSTDGTSWQEIASGTTARLNDVFVAGNQQVVALGTGGTALVSVDGGASWGPLATGLSEEFLCGAARGNGAVIWSTGRCLLWDGASQWEVRYSNDAVISGLIYDPISKVRRNGTGYIGTNIRGEIIYSRDGRDWFKDGDLLLGATADAVSVSGGWVLVGPEGRILRSVPGCSWSAPVQTSHTMGAVVRAGDRFIAFGDYGSGYYSTDGGEWSSTYVGGNGLDAWRAAAARGDTAVAVGSSGSTVRVSPQSATTTGNVGAPVTLNGVAASPDLFVAVGNDGSLFSSPDGLNWTARSSGTTQHLRAIAWHDGKFRAVGDAGVQVVSTNGATWQVSPLPSSANFLAIGAGPQGWVAAGAGGVLYHSATGASWTERESGVKPDLLTVLATDEGWLALGVNSSTSFSADGIHWIPQPVNSEGTFHFTSSCYHGGMVVTTAGPSLRISVFPYGLELVTDPRADLNAVTKRPEGFVAVGERGSIWTSPDGDRWTRQKRYTKSIFNDIRTAGEVSVIAGTEGLVASTDGSDWQQCKVTRTSFRYMPGWDQLVSLAHGGGRWVCGGDSGVLLVSDDGLQWREPISYLSALPEDSLRNVVWGNGCFVAVGEDRTLITSTDGETWTAPAKPATISHDYKEIEWTGSEFWIPVDDGARLLVSANGVDWTLRNTTLPQGNQFYKFLRAEGSLYLLGGNERVESSTDGIDWVRNSSLASGEASSFAVTSNEIKGLARSGPRLVAVGTNGFVMTSDDGYQWTYRHGSMAQDLRGVEHVGDRFIAVGDECALLSSPDGSVWTKHRTEPVYSMNPLFAVATNGNVTVALGNGSAFHSTDLWNWTKSPAPPSASIRKVIWTGDRFIGVGAGAGGAAVSLDGINWTNVVLGSNDLFDVAWSGSIALAVGTYGTYSSPDGLTWTKVNAPWTTVSFGSVEWVGDRFLAYGYYIAESPDGVSGTYLPGPANPPASLVRLSTSHFGMKSLSSLGSSVFHSPDGVNWQEFGMFWPSGIEALAASERQLMAVGAGGKVFTSSATDSLAFFTQLAGEGYSTESDLTLEGDVNGDGISNAVAYYFGLPLDAPGSVEERGRLPVLRSLPGGGQELVFRLSAEEAPSFMDLAIERSSDLGSWQELARRSPGGIWSDPAVSEITDGGFREVTLPVVVTEDPGFWRVKVVPRP